MGHPEAREVDLRRELGHCLRQKEPGRGGGGRCRNRQQLAGPLDAWFVHFSGSTKGSNEPFPLS